MEGHPLSPAAGKVPPPGGAEATGGGLPALPGLPQDLQRYLGVADSLLPSHPKGCFALSHYQQRFRLLILHQISSLQSTNLGSSFYAYGYFYLLLSGNQGCCVQCPACAEVVLVWPTGRPLLTGTPLWAPQAMAEEGTGRVSGLLRTHDLLMHVRWLEAHHLSP